ncbi:Nucleotidyltransferase, partial [Dysosmobacter welbionis]
ERLTGERLFDTDPELKEFDAAAAFDDFVWNGINEIPFASNVASLLGVGDRTLPMPDFSRLVDLPKAISEDGLFSQEVLMQLVGLAGDVLPGGRQIEKSAQGLLALGQGGYYRGSGEDRRLQFPVEQDFWSVLRGTLFGRSALDESRDFYASGQTGLSANQTKAYEQIVDMGADPGTVYQAIQGWRTAENDEDLTSYGRNVAKRDAITEADLTDEQKLALYRGLSDADSSTPDHFREMMDTGLSWEEVMEAYDQYQFLNSDEDVPEADRLSATEKATEFASWVDRQNYTEDQAETVKEALRYWKMIPAEASQKVLVADEYGISNSSRNAVSDEIDRLKGDGNSVTQDLAEEAIQNVPGLSNRERAV